MKVQLLPADQGGCAYYRIHLPGKALQDEGHDVVINNELRGLTADDEHRFLTDCAPAEDGTDVVVLQRPLMKFVVDCIPYLQLRGVAVVVELDDDLLNLPKSNAAYQYIYEADENHHAVHLVRAIKMADLVTVSTPELATKMGGNVTDGGKCMVIRNCTDPSWFDVERKKTPSTTIGWSGHTGTHPGDLESVDKVVGKVISEHDTVRFRQLGGNDAAEKLGVPGSKQSWKSWVPMSEYPKELAYFDIGIVPLVDSHFNRSKSALKGLEYASLGIPFVASALPEYKWLASFGGGWACARTSDWERSLNQLITDRGKYEQMSFYAKDAAREFAVTRHTHRWMEAYEEALKRRRTHMRSVCG